MEKDKKGAFSMVRMYDLKQKEVINMADGSRLGFVADVEFDLKSGKIEAIIIPGSSKMFGMFGHEEEFRIKWSDIDQIGEDLIIVDADPDDIVVEL
jgi:YlmC/YmxH family sporulation protein